MSRERQSAELRVSDCRFVKMVAALRKRFKDKDTSIKAKAHITLQTRAAQVLRAKKRS